MIIKRASTERGESTLDWLDSKHSFSFAHYRDPAHMGFSDLRVINEDIIIPSAGFGTHGHEDMEIITYVLSGALAHKDSMGNGSTIRRGDVQIMSAGTGVTHSEYNASDTEPVHLLQIWIKPNIRGATPDYQEHSFNTQLDDGEFHVVIAPNKDGALRIRQDAELLIGRLKAGSSKKLTLAKGRKAWVQIASGSATLSGHQAEAGDGFAIDSETILLFNAVTDAEILIFDLNY
jgi:quercetin 2,3-dioxygenase